MTRENTDTSHADRPWHTTPAAPPWLQFAPPAPPGDVDPTAVGPESGPSAASGAPPTPTVTAPPVPESPFGGQFAAGPTTSTPPPNSVPTLPPPTTPPAPEINAPIGYAPAGHLRPVSTSTFAPVPVPAPAPQSAGVAPPPFTPPPGMTPPTVPAGFGQPGPALDEVALLRKARRAPSRGWRRAVHTLSAGTINPGDSADDIAYQQLLERLRRPVRGDYRIAVLSLKGGVGKTTTTVGLGSTFASLRGDRVIAVDANPDLGTLAQRLPQQTASTVRNLLADENVYRYSDVRAHTSQAPSRLEVLSSERDPAMAEAFSEDEYRGVITILQRFYNIIITDCGTGLSHSAMNGVLDLANAIILVSSPALDGARSAGATLDWLQAHGYGHLVSRAVVVLSASRPGASTIDTDQLAQHFLTRCRAVHAIPFDDHLSEGADVDLELVSKATRHAFAELAATMADEFAPSRIHHDEPFYG